METKSKIANLLSYAVTIVVAGLFYNDGQYLVVAFSVLALGSTLIVFALGLKPIHKALGLLLVILGFIGCFTGIGAIIGIPTIIIGGIFWFI